MTRLIGKGVSHQLSNRGIDLRHNSHKKGTRGPEVFGGSPCTKVYIRKVTSSLNVSEFV